MKTVSVSQSIRRYGDAHPRLPANAVLSKDAEANTIPFIVAEYLVQAKALGLRGKKKTKFVEDKVVAARAEVRGHASLKEL